MAIDFNEARELFEKSSATELLQACDEDEIIRKIAEEVDGVEEDCVEECVDDLIQGEYLFPNDMELQRELAEADLSISETRLYACTEGCITPEAFKQAVRRELDSCFNLYSTHIGSPVDSRILDLCENGLTRSELEELFDKADFVERLSLAAEFHDKECKYRKYAVKLCTSVPEEVITSMMELEDLNLDAAAGALDLVEEKPELVAELSFSEMRLYACTHGSIAPEAFKQAVRGGLDKNANVYSSRDDYEISPSVLDMCEKYFDKDDHEELFSKADFADRLAIASGFYAAKGNYRTYARDLCTSVPEEVIKSMMECKYEKRYEAAYALDLLDETPKLGGILSEFGYEGGELFGMLRSIAKLPEDWTVVQGIERGVIVNKAALDKVLMCASKYGESVSKEVIASMMACENFDPDMAIGTLDLVEENPELVEELSEFDYAGGGLFGALQSIAASSKCEMLMRSIESGVITNKETLDGVLKPAAGLGVKASRRI